MLQDRKQGVIQVLVKQNMRAQSRLDEQLSVIADYLTSSLVTRPDTLTTSTSCLAHTASQEVDAFANLPLPYIMFSQVDRYAAGNMKYSRE